MQLSKEEWAAMRAAFYVGIAWIDCSREYRKAHPLCERCLARHEISASKEAHHKIRLTPQNINNPDITLNWDNLEALCEDCHKKEHRQQRFEQKKSNQRWRINNTGDVILQDSPQGP